MIHPLTHPLKTDCIPILIASLVTNTIWIIQLKEKLVHKQNFQDSVVSLLHYSNIIKPLNLLLAFNFGNLKYLSDHLCMTHCFYFTLYEVYTRVRYPDTTCQNKQHYNNIILYLIVNYRVVIIFYLSSSNCNRYRRYYSRLCIYYIL